MLVFRTFRCEVLNGGNAESKKGDEYYGAVGEREAVCIGTKGRLGPFPVTAATARNRDGRKIGDSDGAECRHAGPDGF